MTSFRILVFSKSGSLLADVQNGQVPNNEEANFRGILSILDPISVSDSSFLFSMKLGSLNVDISYNFGLYVFSVVSSKTKSSILAYNQIFSYSALLCFTNLISDLPNKESIPKNYIDTYQSMLPTDPLNQVSQIINSLLIDSINYIAFVAQGRRVVLSLGDTKITPDQFILEWCAALDSMESFNEEEPFLIIPNYEKIAVVPFYPCLQTVVFFSGKITKDRIEYYIGEIVKAKKKLIKLFQSKELRPQMPQVPKHNSSGRRKPNLNTK